MKHAGKPQGDKRATRYTFTMEHPGFDGVTSSARPHSVSMTVEGDADLNEVLSRFAEFLRGCGFVVGEIGEIEAP